MIKRNIYKSLLEWKNENGRRPVLLRGARQTGKTFIVDTFGKNEFQNLISINFERNPEFKEIFSTFRNFRKDNAFHKSEYSSR
jgi:predicted AAA+ superfamily ATPase